LAENDIRKFTDDEDVSMRAAAYNELIRRGVRVDEQELEEKLKGLDARIPYSPGSTSEDHSSPQPTHETTYFWSITRRYL
jgi:hypothetical protein